MIYGSVCSGIEAATVAWHPLGWTPKFFAEIELFPCSVLAHHYGSNLPGEALATNGVPNRGDFTKISADAGPVDLLVGGTPCQSFSVAGKRLGLDDPRGNLALEYLALAQRLGARWIVWENVPGVLSSRSGDEAPEEDEDGGAGFESADFATFLDFVRQCGYGFAYRVLDAQYVRVDGFARAVPQRRRRVFVVGYLGDWRIAAAVLLEREGMPGHPPPRREAGQGIAGAVTASAGRRGGTDDPERGKLIASESDVSGTVSVKWVKGTGEPAGDEVQNIVAHTLRSKGFDASEDGTGRGTPIAPICFNSREDPDVSFDRSGALGSSSPQAQAIAIQAGALRENADSGPDGIGVQDGIAYTLEARPEVQAVAFDMRGREGGAQFEGPHETANIRAANGGSSKSYIASDWAVRRLTPTECERLQGFGDGYTDIPVRGKTAADGPRYKALGNSMAVNAMRWIGTRIDIMEGLIQSGRIAG